MPSDHDNGAAIDLASPATYASVRRIALEFGRREAKAREEEFAAEVLYVLGRACPFPALVYFEPDVERLSVRMGGQRWATMTAEEARRAPTPSAAAVLLGLRARDAYLDLEALPHDHPLGQD